MQPSSTTSLVQNPKVKKIFFKSDLVKSYKKVWPCSEMFMVFNLFFIVLGLFSKSKQIIDHTVSKI